MFIEISELEIHPIDWDERYEPGTLDLGPDYQQHGPVLTAGRAQLVEEHHGKHNKVKDIRLAGDLTASLEMACARCLDPITHHLERKFDLLYRPVGSDSGREELSITAAEAEVSYYQGKGLPLEDAIQEQVLLAAPLKAVCRDDCKGLCPHCGKNLNLEQCSCSVPMEDPRWAALRDLRSKLEH